MKPKAGNTFVTKLKNALNSIKYTNIIDLPPIDGVAASSLRFNLRNIEGVMVEINPKKVYVSTK